ncbi:hypothetical protein QJS04_geneDACA015757 [Acorus gramineus]|uniref:Uncharacterized protein n=1 Tax=Acorus gramineus TaxID=55184 RepID=A0AAV9BKX6_ACOGR|nr:hypothetical protein QJS04_geneDACA015757 [Acorus gramineus]
MLSFHIAEIEEQIYVTTGVDANTIRKRNTETGEWCDVAVLPLPISQAEHIPLPVLVGYGFVGCRRKLYVVGGTAVKCNSDLVVIGIVRLNNVRFCNPMVSPLQWKKAKPMRGTPEYLNSSYPQCLGQKTVEATMKSTDSITVDTEKGTTTVVGSIDPVLVVRKLRRRRKVVGIISIEPSKPPETPKQPANKKTQPFPLCCIHCLVYTVSYHEPSSCTIVRELE